MLAAAVYSFVAQGPFSFRSVYEHATWIRETGDAAGPVLTETDMAHLPEPVLRYVIESGAVGRNGQELSTP